MNGEIAGKSFAAGPVDQASTTRVIETASTTETVGKRGEKIFWTKKQKIMVWKELESLKILPPYRKRMKIRDQLSEEQATVFYERMQYILERQKLVDEQKNHESDDDCQIIEAKIDTIVIDDDDDTGQENHSSTYDSPVEYTEWKSESHTAIYNASSCIENLSQNASMSFTTGREESLREQMKNRELVNEDLQVPPDTDFAHFVDGIENNSGKLMQVSTPEHENTMQMVNETTDASKLSNIENGPIGADKIAIEKSVESRFNSTGDCTGTTETVSTTQACEISPTTDAIENVSTAEPIETSTTDATSLTTQVVRKILRQASRRRKRKEKFKLRRIFSRRLKAIAWRQLEKIMPAPENLEKRRQMLSDESKKKYMEMVKSLKMKYTRQFKMLSVRNAKVCQENYDSIIIEEEHDVIVTDDNDNRNQQNHESQFKCTEEKPAHIESNHPADDTPSSCVENRSQCVSMNSNFSSVGDIGNITRFIQITTPNNQYIFSTRRREEDVKVAVAPDASGNVRFVPIQPFEFINYMEGVREKSNQLLVSNFESAGDIVPTPTAEAIESALTLEEEVEIGSTNEMGETTSNTEALEEVTTTEATEEASTTKAIATPSTTQAIDTASTTKAIATPSTTQAKETASTTKAIATPSTTQAIETASTTNTIEKESMTDATLRKQLKLMRKLMKKVKRHAWQQLGFSKTYHPSKGKTIPIIERLSADQRILYNDRINSLKLEYMRKFGMLSTPEEQNCESDDDCILIESQTDIIVIDADDDIDLQNHDSTHDTKIESTEEKTESTTHVQDCSENQSQNICVNSISSNDSKSIPTCTPENVNSLKIVNESVAASNPSTENLSTDTDETRSKRAKKSVENLTDLSADYSNESAKHVDNENMFFEDTSANPNAYLDDVPIYDQNRSDSKFVLGDDNRSKPKRKRKRMDNSVIFTSEEPTPPAPILEEGSDYVSLVDCTNADNRQRYRDRPHKRAMPTQSGDLFTAAERKQMAAYNSNTFNPNTEEPKSSKRMVIIDGCNVAYSHSRNKEFSVRGIEILIEYFKQMGHEVKVVIPQIRMKKSRSSDQSLLEKLHEEGYIVLTPCKSLPGMSSVSYGNRFILQLAVQFDAAIISNDQYRDLLHENPTFKKVIESRVIGYTWCNDVFILATDPYGFHGPQLNAILTRI